MEFSVALDSLFAKLSLIFEEIIDLGLFYPAYTLFVYVVMCLLGWRIMKSFDRWLEAKPLKSTSNVANMMPMEWFVQLKKAHTGKVLDVKEWREDGGVYRRDGGWKGSDYMHAPTAHVRIFDYILYGPGESILIENTNASDYSILSAVAFSRNAESHKGLCHGGTMCAVMDDAIGWCGFCESGVCKPWSGYTVQVDTSLKKPIEVGSVLKIIAWIEKRDRRKIYIGAKLVSADGLSVHATAKGLFLRSSDMQ
jgi:acyl-CoA hydrolase